MPDSVGRDVVNQTAGRKPLAYAFSSGASGWHNYDTWELVAAFGIPDGEHLVIDGMSANAIAADAGNTLVFVFDWMRDEEEDPPLLITPNRLFAAQRALMYHILNSANTSIPMPVPIDVYNTLSINDVQGSDSILTFFFHTEPPGMDWSQENEEANIEIRQIDPEPPAGEMFYQVDVVRQIFHGDR